MPPFDFLNFNRAISMIHANYCDNWVGECLTVFKIRIGQMNQDLFQITLFYV